jgi:DNA-binding transcriptional LysR family regulator
MDLNEILVFARVVEAGSFSAAARKLEMPKSTVSRKVAELEERVGARLLHRTTRKLGLTDAGRIYYEHSARIVAEVEEAEQAVSRMQSAPRGLLRVTAPLSFTMLGPIVAALLQRHPEVQVELVCTDRAVDLVEERFDVAIRAGQLGDSSLVARPLGTIRRVLVAAPSYLKRAGTPRLPADLLRHACICFGAGSAPHVWQLHANGERAEVRATPRLVLNDLEMMCDVAQGGIGIAWIPEYVVAAPLRAGKLKRVLPAWASAPTPVQALYPTARQLSPKVAAFLELVRAQLTLTVAGKPR